MIEEYLMNYGVLGLWTCSLIFERFNFQKGIKNSIDKLTDAINRKF